MTDEEFHLMAEEARKWRIEYERRLPRWKTVDVSTTLFPSVCYLEAGE